VFNLLQFRTDKFIRSTPPIRAAYQRLGQAAENLNDSFIRRRPTNKAMTDNRASSVNSDPCPHFMWSEVGHLSDKAFIVMPRQKPQNALWAFWDFCRGSFPPARLRRAA